MACVKCGADNWVEARLADPHAYPAVVVGEMVIPTTLRICSECGVAELKVHDLALLKQAGQIAAQTKINEAESKRVAKEMGWW
jgi:hypothetical protein